MRKIVTGILALCMVSAIMAEPVLALPDTVKGDVNGDGVINTKDLTMMKKYLLGEEIEIDTDGADLNGDQKINVADMIYLTGILTEAVQPPQDPAEPKDPEPENPKDPEEPKDSVEQKDPEEKNSDPAMIGEMNKTAKKIYNTAAKAEYYLEALHSGNMMPRSLEVYSDEDDNEFTALMKQNLELPEGTHWRIVLHDYDVKGCICTSDGITGAYPNEIPMSLSADYNTIVEEHTEFYSEVNLDWKRLYPECVSADETIKDYVPKTTVQMNSAAETLFGVIRTIQQEGETAGKPEIAPLDYTGIVADGNIEEQCRKKIFGFTNMIPQNTIFSVFVDKGEIVGCICTDSYGKVTGAYPNIVPQTMNIPYTADNARASWDIAFDWKQAFPQYISDDPVQSALPDYPEKPVDQYNDFAKKVFTDAQNIIQEKDTLGESVPNGIYTEENELFANLGGSKGTYSFFVKNGMVIYCLASGGDLTRSGAYPSGIPQNMDIPFEELTAKMPYDPDDFKLDWRVLFPDYASSETQDHKVHPVAFYNSAAKSVFADVQTILYEYETAGNTVPNGIYTSDSELFKELADNEYEFAVRIENQNVLSAVVGCEERSGAYPASVPVIMNVPFDKMLSEIAMHPNTDWNKQYPEAVMDFKSFSAELGDDFEYIPNIRYLLLKASVNTANVNAQSVFTTAQVVAQECETKGEVIDGIFNSSNESSEFVQMIKRDLPPGDFEWSVKVRNNEVVGACASTPYGYTGAYPCNVPLECLVVYNGYNDLCEGAFKSDDWKEVGYMFMP